MAAVVVPIAEWVGSALASLGWSGASVEALYAIGYTATYTALEAALAYGVSEATRPDAPKPQGQELHLQIDPAFPRKFIAGRRAIAGSLGAHYSSGGHNYNIHLVYPLADHPCTSLEKVYADGRLVWGSPLVHGVRTEITTYNFSGGPRVWMTWHDGRPGQAADANLIAASQLDDLVKAGLKPAWTADHRGAGVAYVHVEVQWDDDILTSLPQFLFELTGAPLYDRRKDTTAGGSGSHRLNDPSTWEYSDNVVTAMDHYLLGYTVEDEDIAFGVGLRPDEVPYDLIAAAADIADEDMDVGTGGAADVIKRFRMNGIVSSDELFQSVIEAMQLQFAARIVDYGGRIGIIGAAEQATVVDLTDQDQIRDEAFTFSDKLAFDDMLGAVEGQYADPAQLWEFTDYDRQVSADLILADGGEAQTRTVQFPYETDLRRANRLASAYVQREALPVRIAGKFNQKAWVLEAGDWFTYTSPHEQIDHAVFEVIEIVKFDDFTVGITARAVNPDFLAFDVNKDAPLGVPPDFPPADLRLIPPTFTPTTSLITGGGASEPVIHIGLDDDIDPNVREIVIEVREWDPEALGDDQEEGDDPTGNFTGPSFYYTAHSNDLISAIRSGLKPGTDYRVRVKSRVGGKESPWTEWSGIVTTDTTYIVPFAAGAAPGSDLEAAFNGIAASDFPGFAIVGALGSLTFEANVDAASSIEVAPGYFDHPIHGRIDITDEVWFRTPWGGAGASFAPANGWFAVIWSAEDTATRFDNKAGAGHFFPATFSDGVWSAWKYDTQAGEDFAPLIDDVVCARADKPLLFGSRTLSSADGVTQVESLIRDTLVVNQRFDSLEAVVGSPDDDPDADGSIFARQQHLALVQASDNEARATDIETLEAALGTTNANVTTNATAIADETAARAAAVDTLTADLATANANISTNATAIATEAAARAAAVEDLEASVGDVSAGVSTNATAIATLDGTVQTYYGIKLTGTGADEVSFELIGGSPYGGVAKIKASLFSIEGNALITGSVSASKLNVSQLSAITATIGLLRTASSGARTEIEDNQIRVYDSAGTLRVRMGVWT
jgi:hypothetical protein